MQFPGIQLPVYKAAILLEKEMAIQSAALPGTLCGTEELGGPSIGLHRMIDAEFLTCMWQLQFIL